MRRSLLMGTAAWVAMVTLLSPVALFPTARADDFEHEHHEPILTLATQTGTAGAAQARNPEGQVTLSVREKIELLRQKVRYVFVLFQENRSFDHYFGTYPGANGLTTTYPGASLSDPYSQPANTFASYHSAIRNTDGTYSTISPFLIPQTIENVNNQTTQLYPEDTFSVDHSHDGYVNDFHADQATQSHPQNDGYALNEEGLHYSTDASGVSAPIVTASGLAPTSNPTLQSKQEGEVVMSHVDCDTIPFLWQYADRFALFDNFHQTMVGPSAPNAIAMIAGQTGDTQWVKHPTEADPTGLTLPVLTDSAPFGGSTSDPSAIKPPYGPDEDPSATANADTTGNFAVGASPPNINLTFASLPLSFMGQRISSIVSVDENPTANLADVQQDIKKIAVTDQTVNWGWYQQGFGPEPFDGTSINEDGTSSTTGVGGLHWSPAPEHASYIVHHNGPQYFGYLADNPDELVHMHGLQQFFTDVANRALPESGGVFYVRGGYNNNDGLLPVDPNPNIKAANPGNDDHPNYSDAQISEALIADELNAIATSRYWMNSVIIITYDETDGLYDHQPEQFRTYGPDGKPETGGPRIPAIVISPYSAAHTVSHVYSEHSSVIKFINELFGLTPLSDLPDEAGARSAGASSPAFNGPNGPQHDLGPADELATMGDLLEAFDNDRLTGRARPLPASYAMIPASAVHSLPHYVSAGPDGAPRYGCQYLRISPTDYPGSYMPGGEIDPPPQDFNPRPTQSPGDPYLDTNNNTGGTSSGPWPN
jgi:phospholipase C